MLSVIFFSTWAISFQYFVHVVMQNFPWGRLRQSISQQQIELMNVRCITLCGSSPEVHRPGNVSLSVLEMSPFWRIFRHCLYRNLSKSQLWVQRGLFDKKKSFSESPSEYIFNSYHGKSRLWLSIIYINLGPFVRKFCAAMTKLAPWPLSVFSELSERIMDERDCARF